MWHLLGWAMILALFGGIFTIAAKHCGLKWVAVGFFGALAVLIFEGVAISLIMGRLP